MRTEQELETIHNQMQAYLLSMINEGLKFEVCLSLARQIIRADYYSIDTENFKNILPSTIMEDSVTIMVDPSSTSKKVYEDIINNIFRASKLKTMIKDSKNLKKEQKLILLVEINYLYHYKKISQIQIGDYIDEYKIADVQTLDSNNFSKEVNRFIKLAKAIKTTSSMINPNNYLI